MKKPPIYIFTLRKNKINVEIIDFDYTLMHNSRRPNTSLTLLNNDTDKCRVYKKIPKNPGQVFNNRIWLYHNDINYAKEKFIESLIKRQKNIKIEIDKLKEATYELVG